MNSDIQHILSHIDFENIEKHPNILIAARFWDDERYHAARVCYRFMRMIDDHIDDRKAREEEISCFEKKELAEKVSNWIDCLDQSTNHDPFIEELKETVTRFKIPLQLFHNFAKSMVFDINHNGFSSLEEFIAYADGASVAPASVFVHLCSLSEVNGEYRPAEFDVIEAAKPCALFSYIVHIIRDFQEDQLNNLNYFAIDILEKNRLDPADLKKIAQGAPVTGSFLEVIREYYQVARKYEEETLRVIERLSTRLSGRYLLSLHVIYHLYKQVFDRIDLRNGSFTRQELNPTPGEIREKVLKVTASWPARP